jgi:diguanylate cyclase (GGDEF)-like protein/PAS domain S-box-containing protein
LTLRQRLGLARTDLRGAERHQLAFGRAGATLFAWEATFVLVAALAQGDLGAQVPVLLAVGWAYALGVLVLVAHHRITPAGMHVLAAAAGAIVTVLVVAGDDGDLYGWLYILPVFFVSFFLSPRGAALHVGAIIASFGLAASIAEPTRQAIHAWILGTGALLGAAVLVVVLRGRLHRVVAARTAALERERESRSLLDAFFTNAPASLSFLDCDLRYIRVNDAFCAACGVDPEHAVGRTVREVWPALADEMEPALRRVLETGEAVVGEELSGEAPPGSGQIRHWLVSRYPVSAPNGEVVGVASIAVDATRQKESEARLEELLAFEQSVRLEIEVSRQDLAVQASTDPLTGLANRAAVTHDLELALARAERSSLAVGVLYLDLDGFKGVNDTLGHAAGDMLLRAVANRLRAVARKTDVVARLGGDEFLVLLADLPGAASAADVVRSVAARIVDEVSEPVAVAGDEARVSASVGISLYPWDAADAQSLIANADAAMYASKRTGRGLVQFFADTSEAA